MATYHFTMKAGSKGKGASAGAHAEYIAREGKYSDKPDFECGWAMNVPAWSENSTEFFRAADEYERVNGTAYREIEIALPRELNTEEREALVDDFCQQTFSDKHTYKVAIHNPQAAIDGGEQPHAHIMFCERELDGIERNRETFFKRANTKEPEKGGCKKADCWNGVKRGEHLEQLRENWSVTQNRHLEKAGHDQRVDHRSLADQGIDRAPELHLGPHLSRGPAADLVAEIRQDRERVAELDTQIGYVEADILSVKLAEDLFQPVQPNPPTEPQKPVREAVRQPEPAKPKLVIDAAGAAARADARKAEREAADRQARADRAKAMFAPKPKPVLEQKPVEPCQQVHRPDAPASPHGQGAAEAVYPVDQAFEPTHSQEHLEVKNESENQHGIEQIIDQKIEPVFVPEPPEPARTLTLRELTMQRIEQEDQKKQELAKPEPEPPESRLDYLNREISRRFSTGEADRDQDGTLQLINEREKIKDPQSWGRSQVHELTKKQNRCDLSSEKGRNEHFEYQKQIRKVEKECGLAPERSRGMEMEM